MTKNKSQKKRKLRNNEYYDQQGRMDRLFHDSLRGKIFKNLMKLISTEENIMLAYRNLKGNKGSMCISDTGVVFKSGISVTGQWRPLDILSIRIQCLKQER